MRRAVSALRLDGSAGAGGGLPAAGFDLPRVHFLKENSPAMIGWAAFAGRLVESAADPQHVEIAGTAATAAAAPLSGRRIGGRCRRGRTRRAFGADQNNLVVLGVQRRGFAAGFGLHGLFHREARRAAFLDDWRWWISRTP